MKERMKEVYTHAKISHTHVKIQKSVSEFSGYGNIEITHYALKLSSVFRVLKLDTLKLKNVPAQVFIGPSEGTHIAGLQRTDRHPKHHLIHTRARFGCVA